jgi:hypothetical protein
MMTCSDSKPLRLTLETFPETTMYGAVGNYAQRDREFENSLSADPNREGPGADADPTGSTLCPPTCERMQGGYPREGVAVFLKTLVDLQPHHIIGLHKLTWTSGSAICGASEAIKRLYFRTSSSSKKEASMSTSSFI